MIECLCGAHWTYGGENPFGMTVILHRRVNNNNDELGVVLKTVKLQG